MEKVKFFTHYDRPDCDCEYYEPGTSLTVPDQVEPVSVTVARCLRGEVLTNAFEKPTYYEFNGDVDIDNVNFDVTGAPGFDLADVPGVMASVQSVEATPETVAGTVSEKDAENNKTEENGESQLTQSGDASVSTGVLQ